MKECPFDIKNKNGVIPFKEVDPYNPHNILDGYVNRRQSRFYGSLWITHVNAKKCEQLIYSAPKQHYPFDRDNNWIWPDYDSIRIMEKLDGTAIIAFKYKDSDGNEFLTFKTRLRPFLGESKYGNFFLLWNEMREKYPKIDELCWSDGWNFVFELYGKRNKILIDYDVPLDTRLLFIVGANDGRIVPADSNILTRNTTVPILHGWLEDTFSLQDDYLQWQERLENSLEIDEENKIIKGKEGLVWYFMKDGHSVQIKNKPPSILKYHWSGDAIAYESVYTTVINAFENFDEPKYDDVVGLLQEEFDDDKIEKSRVRIEKCLGKVLFDKKLQYELAEDYRKLGVNINKDKGTVMREMAKKYPKSMTSKVYNLLCQYEEGKSAIELLVESKKESIKYCAKLH